MWSVLVFLAGLIFLMKGSADITKEAQARKRELRRAARRNAEFRRREQMQAQYRAQMEARRSTASSERERQAHSGRTGYGYDPQNGAGNGYVSYSVMGYGYAPNRKPIRRNAQRRTAVKKAPQPVLTA